MYRLWIFIIRIFTNELYSSIMHSWGLYYFGFSLLSMKESHGMNYLFQCVVLFRMWIANECKLGYFLLSSLFCISISTGLLLDPPTLEVGPINWPLSVRHSVGLSFHLSAWCFLAFFYKTACRISPIFSMIGQ